MLRSDGVWAWAEHVRFGGCRVAHWAMGAGQDRLERGSETWVCPDSDAAVCPGPSHLTSLDLSVSIYNWEAWTPWALRSPGPCILQMN